MIVDDKGNVLRHRRDMSEATAKSLASALWKLTSRAQHTVRDIDPTDRLNFFRLRMEKIEVLVAPGEFDAMPALMYDALKLPGSHPTRNSLRAHMCIAGPGYMVIVSQEWTPAAWSTES